MNRAKEPLYRKVNTKAHNVHHNHGKDASDDRNTKNGVPRSMKSAIKRGVDYTPLYKFLLSKVGENWEDIHKETIQRLDNEEPIYDIVAIDELNKHDLVRLGESSYYNGLFVDENNTLQIVNTSVTNESLHPTCNCCTHTFNGKAFTNKFKD